MDLKKIEDFLIALDNYISANSLSLTFIAVSLGFIIFIFVLIYFIKTGRKMSRQNENLIRHFENDLRNHNIDRSIGCIREFDSSDFRGRVLSPLEVNLKMLEGNEISRNDIENDPEFNLALSRISHFFNNTGYLYTNELLDETIIFNSLRDYSVKWYEKLEPYMDSDTTDNGYWIKLNEILSKSNVLKLEEEVNPINEKALF